MPDNLVRTCNEPVSTETEISSEELKRRSDQIDRPLLTLFRRYGHGSRKWFFVGVLTSMASRFLSLVPPVILGTALDSLFNDARAFSLPFVPQSWLPASPTGQFWLSVALMGVATFGIALTTFGRQSTLNLFSHRVKHEARTDTYQQMQRLDMDFFHDMQTGELMSILSNDTNRLELFLDNMMASAIQLGVLVLGVAAVLFWLNPQLAVVTLLVVPLGAVFTYWFMKSVEEKYADVRSSVGDLNSRLENNLAGIQVIKANATEDYEDERVKEESYNYFRLDWLALRLNFIYQPGMRVLTSASFIVTFIVGGLWVIGGPFGPFTGPLYAGELVTFLLLTQRLTQPLAQMSTIIDRYEDAAASTRRILGLLDMPVDIQDPEDPVEIDTIEGDVVYDDVDFRYEPAGELVLQDVDFHADPGETIGLVGPTGAGKTTIVKLLLRLYDVDGSEAPVRQPESHGDAGDVADGEIRIDGHDVRDMRLDDLRGAMGYVGQENFLFDGSVHENIAYGNFDATREDVKRAAKRAEAHEFIERMPEGYDTQVGERGVKLSGGQRQRVAIARTILADPEIMIFDEATSAVDTETEMLIQRSIDDLAADRTTFIIAHRLSTVRDADKILVVERGQIVERGTHDDLLEEDGLYANLWRVQAGEIEDLPEDFVEQAHRRVAQRVDD
jgi:ATP-binding cassette subfamily B protein